ncbi:hypothetical protein [Ornithinimicrobium panacihumi]|uniref:hypothetical protein n=1 Tax=Ornithinimicrobium panacihumi TaxID=2008449 RepID=UPI003F885F9E
MSIPAEGLSSIIDRTRDDLRVSQDRLRSRWATIVTLESQIVDGTSCVLTVEQRRELGERLAGDVSAAQGIHGCLRWATRVDAGEKGEPSLVSEGLQVAVTRAASLISSLEAASITLALTEEGTVVTSARLQMCRRFLAAAQQDLNLITQDLADLAGLVPPPPARWQLRAVV